MIKLVAVDMDATFLRDDKTYDVTKFKSVLKRLKEKNILFVVASGNGVSKLETSFDTEDKSYIIFAGDNGNHIQHHGNCMKIHGIKRDELKSFLTFLMTHDGYYPIINSTHTNYILPNNSKDAVDAFYRYNVSVTQLNDIEELPYDAPFLNVAVYFQGELEKTKRFAQEIMKKFPFVHAVTSGERWMDVFRVGGGKGTAITFLQQQHNISPKECIAFGDSLNDLSMMKVVGKSIAMKNADVQLTAICTHQIGTNNEQSVLHVLDEWLTSTDENSFKQYEKSLN